MFLNLKITEIKIKSQDAQRRIDATSTENIIRDIEKRNKTVKRIKLNIRRKRFKSIRKELLDIECSQKGPLGICMCTCYMSVWY